MDGTTRNAMFHDDGDDGRVALWWEVLASKQAGKMQGIDLVGCEKANGI